MKGLKPPKMRLPPALLTVLNCALILFLPCVQSHVFASGAVTPKMDAVESSKHFKTHPPANWKIELSPSEAPLVGTLFVNTRSKKFERVVTEYLPVANGDDEFHANLKDHKGALHRARAEFFALYGLNQYQILSIEKEQLKRGKFDYAQVLRSSYVNSQGKEVQAMERQYQRGGQLYVVVYLVEDVSLGDQAKVDALLDSFEPVYAPSRVPSTETISSGAVESGQVPPESDPSTPPVVKDLDMKDPRNQKLCENVPEELRRKPNHAEFMTSFKGKLAIGGSCIVGIGTNLWNLVSGTASLVATSVASSLRQTYDLQYRNEMDNKAKALGHQVTVSTGAVVSELWNDPKVFTEHLISGLLNFMVKRGNRFIQCYHPEEQARRLCSLASNLIPLKFLWASAVKVARKVALTADEASKLAEALNGVSELEKPALARAAATKPPLRELLKAYPNLSLLAAADQARIIEKIAKLEASGVPRTKIRDVLNKAETQCSIR